MLQENKSIYDQYSIKAWHQAGYTGKGVSIAILDEEGAPRPFMNYAVDALGVFRPFDQLKDVHGTSVVQVIHEWLPDVTVYMLDSRGTRITACIEWLLANEHMLDIVNISLASYSIPERFTSLQQLKIPILAASGNEGGQYGIAYPAKFPWTIAVGAYSHYANTVISYSDTGQELDCVCFCPMFIPIDAEGKDTLYFNGTSCACPSATGQLGAYVQWRKERGLPKLEHERARQFIHNNCIDIGEPGFDHSSGHGLFILPDVSKMGVVETKEIIMDTPAKLLDGRFHVPVRFLVEALGGCSEWDEATRTGTFKLNGREIIMQAGSNKLVVK